MEDRKSILGIDLSAEHAQIARYDPKTGQMAVDPLDFEGGEAALQAIFDKWALKAAAGDSGETVLSEFIGLFRAAIAKRGITNFEEDVDALMLTFPSITQATVLFAKAFFRRLRLSPTRAFLQDHLESFYYEILYEDEELWRRDVGLFYFSKDKVRFVRLHLNQNTRPVTAASTLAGEIELLGNEEEKQEKLLAFVKNMIGKMLYSAILLKGSSMEESFARPALREMTRSGRKVFREDYVFSRGACRAALERTGERRLSQYFYLSDGLVHLNIGMYMINEGIQSFVPLMNAGLNWYEAENTREVILEKGNELVFLVSRIDNPRRKPYKMQLHGLMNRPERTTRLQIRLYYPEIGKCRIEVTDMGFGEFFPSDDRIWEETIEEGESL